MKTTALAAAALAALGLAAAAPRAGAAQRLDVRANVGLLPGGGATLRQQGSFTGAPLGAGTVNVATDVGRGRGALVNFRMFNRRGSVWGSGSVKVTFHGSTVIYDGTARITGGSGAFSRIRSRSLRVSGRGDITGSRFAVRLAGPTS